MTMKSLWRRLCGLMSRFGSFRGILLLFPHPFRLPFSSFHFHVVLFLLATLLGRESGEVRWLCLPGSCVILEESLCSWTSSTWHRALPGGPAGFYEPRQASGEVFKVTLSVRFCSCFPNLSLVWLFCYLPTFAWAHPRSTFVWDYSPENCGGR